MKTELTRLAARIQECCEAIEARDELATKTAKRLDRHVTSSQEVHRELRGRLAVLEEHVKALLARTTT